MRTSTISAAATGRPAACDLGDALEQHLPGAREHAHRQLLGKTAPARALDLDQRRIVGDRRHDLHAGDEMGELGEIGEHHRRDRRRYRTARAARSSAAATSPRISASNRSMMRVRSARPSICRTSSARTGPAACAIAWSSSESESRTEPSAARAISASASGSTLMASLSAIALEMLHQQAGIDAAQVEALAARQHGDRHLADLGGGEDELGVRRRLLQRLEQGVERRARQHVHFVEDVDLVARGHRRVAHRVVDLAHVVDAVVRGRVHLDHVEVPALHDRLAMQAEHRHLDGRAGDRAVRQLVVERTGENARGRGLADAAHAGEDPGLRNAAGLERIRDRAHHGVLADQVVEGRRPVFARQHAIRRVARAPGCAAEIEAGLGMIGIIAVVHRVIRLESLPRGSSQLGMGKNEWEADERPEPELVRAASFRT